MEYTAQAVWRPLLADPSGQRLEKPRTTGMTMVIDKGIGLHVFEDLLKTSAAYIDMIKLGFGTSPLYPLPVLKRKIELAKEHGIILYPGGTFLEVAVRQGEIEAFFETVQSLRFTGIEVSDGTIEMSRELRNALIERGKAAELKVMTEYGKKAKGSGIDIEALVETVRQDAESGADMVIVEGRESGTGVGLYDDNGECDDGTLREAVRRLAHPDMVMWEAPLRKQQVHLLKTLGMNANLGNIGAEDVLSLECLRRGLRSDTFAW